MSTPEKNPFEEIGFKLLRCRFCGKRIKSNAMGRTSHLRSKAHLEAVESFKAINSTAYNKGLKR